jgi:hypothetical protein
MDFLPVQCPYCFENTEVEVDPETEGTFVSDCPVCCNPWQVTVTRDEEGEPTVQIDRAD